MGPARPWPPLPAEVRIDFALGEAAKKRPFSGVLMIASADRVVTRTAGFADGAAGPPITEQSRFVIGSLAKQVTAALVMREVEAGRVRLDFSRCGIARPGSDDPGRDPLLVVGHGESADGQLTSLALPPETRSHLASGGLLASASDLVQWSRCLHGGPAVSAESYERMTTPSTSRTHRWGSLGYGFGLQVLDSEGLLEISHSGYVPGFVSTLIVYPKHCVTVAVLENVATSASDMDRAFAPHDAIRSEIRHILQNTQSNERGCEPVAAIAADTAKR